MAQCPFDPPTGAVDRLDGVQRILVTGASGNVGGLPIDRLRGRAAAAVAGVTGSGATDGAVHFDFLDATTWRGALDGVDRMFLMRPPAFGEPKTQLRPFIEEMARRGVRHVAVLSVMGVDRAMPHWQVEHDVKASGIGWTMLRPAFFMQDLIGPFGADIRLHDRITEPAGRARFSFVDAADVAEVADIVLAAPAAHAGRSYTLTGGEALGYGGAHRHDWASLPTRG